MTTYGRAKTVRQQAHTDSTSLSHLRDKIAGEQRRKHAWVRLDPDVSPCDKPDFAALGTFQICFDDGKWKSLPEPGAYAKWVVREARMRRRYRAKMARKDKVSYVTRKASTPLEILTVTFSPWLAAWTAAQIHAGLDPRPALRQLLHSWFVSDALPLLDGVRHVIGLAMHSDSGVPHLDILMSRQSRDGAEKIGPPGVYSIGPWSVGVSRQLNSGARVHSEKLKMHAANLRKHCSRYGDDHVPLDLSLAQRLDARADTAIAGLKEFRASYAASVPGLEKAHQRRALATAEARVQQLRSSLPDTPLPEL